MLGAVKKFISQISNQNIDYWLLAIIWFLFTILTIYCLMLRYSQEQYVLLANSFWQGHLHFLDQWGPIYDSAAWHGHFYWPLGMLPAILMMPFTLIAKILGSPYYQACLHIPFLVIIGLIINDLLIKFDYQQKDRFYLIIAFIICSPLLGVALISDSWQFAQMTALLLSCWSLWEFYQHRRYWLIGILCATILLTRPTASLIIFFYILNIILIEKNNIITKLRQLLWPYIIGLMMMFGYNFWRFQNPWESGYSLQLQGTNSLLQLKQQGIFHWRNVGRNLFYLLFQLPLISLSPVTPYLPIYPYVYANPWGLSIFFTSPYLFTLFYHHYKKTIEKIIWLTIFIILIPIVFYYGVGWYQFGYRYALDFWPLLFLLFTQKYREKNNYLSDKIRIVIIISAIFNLYLFFTLYS